MNTLYTIGHSNMPIDEFIQLLKQYNIQIVCDVRSHPYSKFVPHFNAEALRNALLQHNIKYLYLGKELGPRSTNPNHYIDGKVSYQLLEQSSQFQNGLQRLTKGIEQFTIALLCSEKDPINCHRAILICKNLPHDISIYHILSDSSLESHQDLEQRLVVTHFKDTATLFNNYQELLQQAYLLQANKLAYSAQTEEEE